MGKITIFRPLTSGGLRIPLSAHNVNSLEDVKNVLTQAMTRIPARIDSDDDEYTKAKRAALPWVGGLIEGQFKAGAMTQCVMSLLVLDLDKSTDAEITATFDALKVRNLNYLAHTTTGDGRGGRASWRVILPLSEPIDALTCDWAAMYNKARIDLLPGADASTKDATRWFYMAAREDQTLTWVINANGGNTYHMEPIAIQNTLLQRYNDKLNPGAVDACVSRAKLNESIYKQYQKRFLKAFKLSLDPVKREWLRGKWPITNRDSAKSQVRRAALAINSSVRDWHEPGTQSTAYSAAKLVALWCSDQKNIKAEDIAAFLYPSLQAQYTIAQLDGVAPPSLDQDDLLRACEKAFEEVQIAKAAKASFNDEGVVPEQLSEGADRILAISEIDHGTIITLPLSYDIDDEGIITEDDQLLKEIMLHVLGLHPEIFQIEGTLVRPLLINNTLKTKPISINDIKELFGHNQALRVKRVLNETAVIKGAQPKFGFGFDENLLEEICSSLVAKERVKEIRAVSTVPVLKLQSDGTVGLQTSGYDADTCTLVADTASNYPPLPDLPTAVETLKYPVRDLPIKSDHHWAVHLAHILTYHARPLLGNERTPFFLYGAFKEGAGKSTLAAQARATKLGDWDLGWSVNKSISPDKPTEEFDKALLGCVLSGANMLFPDNITTGMSLANSSFETAITGHTMTLRNLGKNEIAEVRVSHLVWCATGNGLTIRGDLSRRTVHITLESPHSKPSSQIYKYKISDEIKKTLPLATMSALAILKEYFEAGCPGEKPGLGNFQSWVDICLGAACWALGQDPKQVGEAISKDQDAHNDTAAELDALWAVFHIAKKAFNKDTLTVTEIKHAYSAPDELSWLKQDNTAYASLKEAISELKVLRSDKVDVDKLKKLLHANLTVHANYKLCETPGEHGFGKIYYLKPVTE